MDLKHYIRTVPDFPKKGIMFRDVMTLFSNSETFIETIDQLIDCWADKNVGAIAGIDARGFIIGGALAYNMRVPFVALRKKGKLPSDTISQDYELEYGTETLEIQRDAVTPGASVLIVDDLIATGGTALAGIKLLQALGAEVVGCGFVINLPELGGAEKIQSLGLETRSLMAFEGH